MPRNIETKNKSAATNILKIFAEGLKLLDDYDHKKLDKRGISKEEAKYPTYEDYLNFISVMYSDFSSDVFAQPKDESFHGSINNIKQTFSGKELYPTLQEKAANLLYSIVKNHSFVDGNKRIAAACFLFFLDKNEALFIDEKPIISNEALAALTLYIAISNPKESDTVKRFVISILNRNL